MLVFRNPTVEIPTGNIERTTEAELVHALVRAESVTVEYISTDRLTIEVELFLTDPYATHLGNLLILRIHEEVACARIQLNSMIVPIN